MIDNILDYIESYDNIRSVCGLSSEELTDDELSLSLYRNYLGLTLAGTSGIYAPETESKTLEELFLALDETNVMWVSIQQFAIYVVADCVMGAVGLRAYKTQSDGKSTLVRFSPESTYNDTKASIRNGMSRWLKSVHDLFGTPAADGQTVFVVPPDVDVVTGE